MEEATTTPPIEDFILPPAEDIIIFETMEVSIPLEQTSFSYATTAPDINVILDNYFSIFPVPFLLLLVGIGISAVLVYTLYNYLDQ